MKISGLSRGKKLLLFAVLFSTAAPVLYGQSSYRDLCVRRRCDYAAIADFHMRYRTAANSGNLRLTELAGSDEIDLIDRMLDDFLENRLPVRRRDIRDMDRHFLNKGTFSGPAPVLGVLYLFTDLDGQGDMLRVPRSGPLPPPPNGKQWTSAQAAANGYWVLDDGPPPGTTGMNRAPVFGQVWNVFIYGPRKNATGYVPAPLVVNPIDARDVFGTGPAFLMGYSAVVPAKAANVMIVAAEKNPAFCKTPTCQNIEATSAAFSLPFTQFSQSPSSWMDMYPAQLAVNTSYFVPCVNGNFHPNDHPCGGPEGLLWGNVLAINSTLGPSTELYGTNNLDVQLHKLLDGAVFHTDGSVDILPNRLLHCALTDVQAAVGGTLVVQDGNIDMDAVKNRVHEPDTLNARTAIGIDAKGNLSFVVIQTGKDAPIEGVDAIGFLNYMLKAFNPVRILMLDGGGSSTFSYMGPGNPVNTPAGDRQGYRPVTNILVVQGARQ